ncbi:PREDICTED: uncharacterized protein LOC109174466 [Ipomoea nil]|uniref:uncharacterized protein LOC109174466 n=1 Tax=Ipomoea nil TaxID=35883 RepID=UPI000901E1D9|nr:PREDICTED: uncharacterized protein LOC109174466 [Ipomoea nil]
MIFLVWNCQGAASKAFRRIRKQFLCIHKPSFVCLLEPKVSGQQANEICFSLGFDDWMRVEAIGFSGGIWILWKSSIHIEVLDTHPQFISLQVQDADSESWLLSVVYGSPNKALRKRLFSELSGQFFMPHGPWLAVGDFNSVTCQDEVNNLETFSMSRCSDFNQWIFREGLIDLGFEGTKFTWMRGVNSTSFKGARLDRALSNIEWRSMFPNVSVLHLPMIQSDHSPLLVNTSETPQIPINRSFRFNMAWASHANFQPLVKSCWSTNRSLNSNKNEMAVALSSWNINTFGNIFHRKNRLLARLGGIQRSLSLGARSDLIRLERRLRKELDETLHQEEMVWFQRSREQWITSGDLNTRFYHLSTTIKGKQAKANAIKDMEGTIVTGEESIKNLFRDYFMNLFEADNVLPASPLPQGRFPSLNVRD